MSRGYDRDDDRDDREEDRRDRDRDERDDYDDDDYDRRRRAPHRGVLILVLGILGIVACGPLAVAAWMMGSKDLTEIRAGRMDPSGKDMTQIGYVLGIIGSLLLALSLVFVCLWFAVVGAAIGAGAGGK
jgi:hypothetical protein